MSWVDEALEGMDLEEDIVEGMKEMRAQREVVKIVGGILQGWEKRLGRALGEEERLYCIYVVGWEDRKKWEKAREGVGEGESEAK